MSETSKKIVFIASAFDETTTDYQIQTINELSKNSVVVLIRIDEDFSTFFFKKLIMRQQLHPILEAKSNYHQLRFFPFLPFGRFTLIRKFNIKITFFLALLSLRLQSKVTLSAPRILWIFHPTNFSTVYEINKLVDHSLYDCVDWFEYFPEEKIISKMVDYCYVNSTVLFKKINSFTKKVAVVPQGFRLNEFEKYTAYNQKKVANSKPIIGYIGGINDRLDYDILLRLAKENQQWIFLFCGPIYDLKNNSTKMQLLFNLNNVIHYIADKKHMPHVINHFDVAIIPYHLDDEFNKFCYPMKIFEYFYCGKPVVSSDIRELRKFHNLVIIAENNSKSWKKSIQRALSSKLPKHLREKQKQLAIQNSWQIKIQKILSKIKYA